MFSSVGAYGRSWGGGGGSWRVGQLHDVVWTEDAVDGWWFAHGLADVSPMVGKLSEIIPNAMHASRLRNSLS